MTFWNQELDMLNFIYNVIKAKNLTEFEAAASLNSMSFNLSYAGNDQKIKYWHIGKYQDRSDGIDPRLPHKGDGSEEWGGFLEFANLPTSEDLTSGYFVNWNNKPIIWWDNGDNIPWVGSHPVLNIDDFVNSIGAFSYQNLKDVPQQINSHGTYQQAIEFTDTEILDENILPPGQSGFIDLNGTPSIHCTDQWQLHLNWEFKDMEFGLSPFTIINQNKIYPIRFLLHQNNPNPFNPSTQIRFVIPKNETVKIDIFNSLGQCIETILNENMPTGEHKIAFTAYSLATGVYYYRIKAGQFQDVKKMILLR
jgi:hypothetical protein